MISTTMLLALLLFGKKAADFTDTLMHSFGCTFQRPSPEPALPCPAQPEPRLDTSTPVSIFDTFDTYRHLDTGV